MTGVFADLRYALRRLRRSPDFTATAVVTLSLGIGCTTAMFSVVDGVLLRPLPWREPNRLVTMWIVRPHWRQTPALAASWDRGVLSWPNFRDIQQHSQLIEEVAVWRTASPILSRTINEVLPAMFVSSSFLPLLGVQPHLGRFFDAREDESATDSVVVSYEAWRRRFAGDVGILGRSLALDGVSRTIIGVLPPHFTFDSLAPEFVLPFGNQPVGDRSRGNHAFRAVARLKPSVTIDDALRDVEPVLRAGENPQQRTARLEFLTDTQLGASRRPLWALSAAAGLLLLIACANVAGLLLGEVGKRRQEFAVRTALGAARTSLIKGVLAESFLVALAGAVLGVVLARALTPAVIAMAPSTLPRIETVGIDVRVLLFAIGLVFLTACAFGIGPSLILSRARPAVALREGRDSGLVRRRFRSLLVVIEVAVAFVLLVGASLLGETVLRLNRQSVGFDTENLVLLSVRAPRRVGEPATTSAQRLRLLEERLGTLPGVRGVAAGAAVPFFGGYGSNLIEIEGQKTSDPWSASRQIVTSGYFSILRLPLIKGRHFTPDDQRGEAVAVVSKTFELRYLQNDALNRRFRFNLKSDAWYRIVGVVADTKQRSLAEPDAPTFYVLNTGVPTEFVVRTFGDPRAMIPAIRENVRAHDPELVVMKIGTMESSIRRTISPEVFRATLAVVFGGAALLLAVVGMYALLSRRVTERTHEIGLRMALGAKSTDVLRLIVSQSGPLVVAGLLLGLPGAFIAAHLLSSLLYGVSPMSFHTFALTAGSLVCVALIATAFPARRAARVDPIVALRCD